jgi:hypothetical protein
MQLTLSRFHITVFSVLLCSGAGACLSLLMLGEALAQDKDIREASQSNVSTLPTVTPVNSRSQRLFINDSSSLKSSLETQGWTWIDQAGPFSRYRKGIQALTVNCGMSSPEYVVCDLNQTL